MVDIEKLDPELREKVYRPSSEETEKQVSLVFEGAAVVEEEELPVEVT